MGPCALTQKIGHSLLSLLSFSEVLTTKIGPCAVAINAETDDHNAINTSMESYYRQIWRWTSVFFADQVIYSAARETIWTRGDDNVHFRLGGLFQRNNGRDLRSYY